MTTFDQRGQNVKYQYNAGGNINFLSAQNKIDAITQLNNLIDDVKIAIERGTLSPELGKSIQDKLEQATALATAPKPDKKSILTHLNDIGTTIKDMASLSGLITAIMQAAEMIKRLF